METIPSRLCFHRNSAFPKENPDLTSCDRAILGSFLESSRSPEIAFFGSDPLPKVIKSSQRIKCTNFRFSTAKLGFSPQGDKGGREAIKLQVFSAHSRIFNSNPSLQMWLSPKSTLFGRRKIGQPKPTKVLLFIHSHRNFPEQAPNMQTKKKNSRCLLFVIICSFASAFQK